MKYYLWDELFLGQGIFSRIGIGIDNGMDGRRVNRVSTQLMRERVAELIRDR